MAMKKILTLTAAALLTVSLNQVFAQRTIKNVRFDGISLNISPDSFIEKLEKKDWKTISVVSATDSQERSYVKTTLEGKVNGIDISATIIPEENLEKVSKIIMFTEADSTLNKTRYDVIKSWLENQYDKPTVSDLESGDGNISSYWGDFKSGERDLQKNHISLTTVDRNFVVVTINNLETGLDATMNNIGDAIERAGDKLSKTGQKAKEKGQDIKEKVSQTAENIAEKAEGPAQKVSRKAKKIANAAANGAKEAWKSIKDAVKSKDNK